MTLEPGMVTPRNFASVPAAAGASGTWDWDIRRDILHIDENFAELYGLQPEAAHAGLPTNIFFQAIHPDDRPRIRIAVAGLLAGAELFAKDFRIVTAAGAVLWMHGRGHCHLSDNDEPLRFTGLLVDITERKRAEENYELRRVRAASAASNISTVLPPSRSRASSAACLVCTLPRCCPCRRSTAFCWMTQRRWSRVRETHGSRKRRCRIPHRAKR
jgi:PAS domain S-box-containing protein